MMAKNTKRRVFISKIHVNNVFSPSCKVQRGYYFWYQVGTGNIRTLLKGTKKELTDQREELIEKYKSDYIKLGV